MRCATVASIKYPKRSRIQENSAPKAGTNIRSAYDLFKQHPGEPVEFKQFPNHITTIPKLTDYYGLDIRKVQQGNSRTGRPSLYMLVGEWFGRVYIDYVAQRIEQSDLSAHPDGEHKGAALTLRAGAAPVHSSMRS